MLAGGVLVGGLLQGDVTHHEDQGRDHGDQRGDGRGRTDPPREPARSSGGRSVRSIRSIPSRRGIGRRLPAVVPRGEGGGPDGKEQQRGDGRVERLDQLADQQHGGETEQRAPTVRGTEHEPAAEQGEPDDPGGDEDLHHDVVGVDEAGPIPGDHLLQGEQVTDGGPELVGPVAEHRLRREGP